MKAKRSVIASLVAIAFCNFMHAATRVKFSFYTASGSDDTSWVAPAGFASVKALKFGSAPNTSFGSINCLASNRDVGTWGAGTYNENGPIDIILSSPGNARANNASIFFSVGPDLLNDRGWTGDLSVSGRDYVLEINDLTVGLSYMVQFIIADTRTNYKGNSIVIDNYSSNFAGNTDSASYQFTYADGRFAVVTATFTANESNFPFRSLNGGGLQRNGVQLLAVPELSTSLPGGLNILVLLRPVGAKCFFSEFLASLHREILIHHMPILILS